MVEPDLGFKKQGWTQGLTRFYLPPILQLCVVVNNIEQLRMMILKLPKQLDWARLEQNAGPVITPEQIQHTLHQQLQASISCLNNEIRGVVQTLAIKVTSQAQSSSFPPAALRGQGTSVTRTVKVQWQSVIPHLFGLLHNREPLALQRQNSLSFYASEKQGSVLLE